MAKQCRWSVYVVAGLLLGGAYNARAAYPFEVLQEKIQGGSTTLIGENPGMAPVSIVIELSDADNVGADHQFPLRILVPPRSTTVLVNLFPQDTSRPSSFRTNYSWRLGDPNAVHDPEAHYRLPYPNRARFRISQALGGTMTSHNAPPSLYAVDVAMPEGTEVLAARSGHVVDIVDGFGEGAAAPEYLDKANYVRVLHDDGTWADYAHLLRGTVKVRVGDRVEAGAVLAQSGNSGFSSGPHLHFVVQKNNGDSDLSLPFTFYTRGRGAYTPQQGQAVRADYDSHTALMQ